MERSSSSSRVHRKPTGSISYLFIRTSRSHLLREGLYAKEDNSHAHTETSYLKENFLPDFLDMVIWGHEHECLIDPKYNPETNFHVMQPGSSIATSLMPGEAVPKHVAVLSITGRDFAVEPIRLKTVRPFVMREIVLSEEKEPMKVVKKANNRTELTAFLTSIIDDMIEQANEEWKAAQGDDEQENDDPPPLPLIRLRVEYTAPEGGNFDCENPQRFSNRFTQRVANIKDVVQFYRKKAGGTKIAQNGAEMPEESMLASLTIDTVKVEKLVRDFLAAQSLTVLPQNSFGDAVSQFIDKDDKHAMEEFVTENLSKQVEQLMKMDELDEDNIRDAMEEGKSHLEELFASGDHQSKRKKAKRKPRPDDWDSDFNGEWDKQPAAIDRSDIEDEDDDESDEPVAKPIAKGRGKTAPKKAAAPAKKTAPAKNVKRKKRVDESEEEDEDEDVDDSDEDESQLFVKPEPSARGSKKAVPMKAPAPKRAPARAAAAKVGKQSQLNFSQPTTQPRGAMKKPQEVSDDEISDDDDAFEPAPSARTSRSRR